MVRGYRNTQWRKIDLKRLDFSKGTTWPLDDGSLGWASWTSPMQATAVPARSCEQFWGA